MTVERSGGWERFDLRGRLTRIKNGLCPECGGVMVVVPGGLQCPRWLPCESPEVPRITDDPQQVRPMTSSERAWAVEHVRKMRADAVQRASAALDREPDTADDGDALSLPR